LQKHGVVFGAAFDQEFRVCHKKAETAQERVNSGFQICTKRSGKHLPDVKAELDKKRDVLFTGTPCQIAG
jgi:hypothetical protein